MQQEIEILKVKLQILQVCQKVGEVILGSKTKRYLLCNDDAYKRAHPLAGTPHKNANCKTTECEEKCVGRIRVVVDTDILIH